MLWGIFEKDDGPHVCPTTEEGDVLPPHTLTNTCECRPSIERLGWKSCNLIAHHDNH